MVRAPEDAQQPTAKRRPRGKLPLFPGNFPLSGYAAGCSGSTGQMAQTLLKGALSMPSVYLALARVLPVLVLVWMDTPAFAQPMPPAQSPPAPPAPSSPVELPLTAQLLSPQKITLKAALEFALKNQPAVREALARIAARQTDVGIPAGQWLPTVGVTAQVLGGTDNNTTASYLNTPWTPTPRVGGTTSTNAAGASWSAHPSTFVGLGLMQEVFDFGRITAEIQAADSLVTAEQRSAEARALDVQLGVEEAYFAVYSAKAVLAATDEAYARASLQFELARVGVNAGLRPPIDQTRIRAQLARFEVGRIRNRGEVRIAQSLLAAAVGSPELVLDTADAPPTPADLPSLDVAIQHALKKEPGLQAALARIQAQEDETKAAYAQLRPDLFLSGTLNSRAGGAQPSGGAPIPDGNGWIPSVPNWQVGLVLSWPIFEGTFWAKGRASAQLESVRREQAALVRQELLLRIENAYVAVVVAREALPRIRDSLEAARANYAQADARFRAGLGSATDLADAASIWVEAQTALALAEFDLARSRATFGRAIAEGL